MIGIGKQAHTVDEQSSILFDAQSYCKFFLCNTQFQTEVNLAVHTCICMYTVVQMLMQCSERRWEIIVWWEAGREEGNTPQILWLFSGVNKLQYYGTCVGELSYFFYAPQWWILSGSTSAFLLLQSECILPGTARPGLEVVNPYVQSPLGVLPLNTVATAITHTTLDGALFLFAATTGSELVQVSWIVLVF